MLILRLLLLKYEYGRLALGILTLGIMELGNFDMGCFGTLGVFKIW